MKKSLATLLLTVALAAAAPAIAQAAPPTILATSTSATTTDSVVLEAEINPKGKATKYFFEYGPADCAGNPCESTPKLQLPSGESPVTVSATIGGLTPGATYHFRAIAEHTVEAAVVNSADRLFATYLPPQSFGPCPNDQLRKENPAAARIESSSANLPDCRAYEQATPLDKGAGDVTAKVPFARAASQGGAVSFLSVSGVPGGVGSQEIPAYVARRGAGSWSTQGVLPPASAGQKARVLGWTADFSDFFTAPTFLDATQTTALLDTDTSGPPLALTAYLPGLRPELVGATAGGALVFFESKVAIPGVTGALAGKPNVYVWTKASETIRLADAMNDATAPPLGAHAGSYDWVNGTSAATLAHGSAENNYYLQDTHAFAADGSALHFTDASSGNLYVRLNPTAPQSPLDGSGNCTVVADACTIEVSATRRTNPGPDPAGTAPAAFMAASADGRTSLFTSSEMLTNDANTGVEQEPPGVVSAGIAAGEDRRQCVPTHAQAVAVDSEHIYWIDLRSGAIGRATLDCDGIDDLFLTPAELEIEPGVAANPRGLAVQDGYLYWAAAAEEEGEGTIGRAKLNGTGDASEVDPDLIADAGNPQGVATDSEHVYWTDSLTGFGDKAFIGKAELDGGEVEPELVEIFRNERVGGIAVDSEHIYWTMNESANTPKAGAISRAQLDGTEYDIIYIFIDNNTPNGQGLTVQANHIYWAAENFDEIGRAQLNGEADASDLQPEFIPDAGNPRGLATDASQIYWTAHAEAAPNPGKDLYRYDAGTGTLEDLAPDHSNQNGAEVRGVLGTSEDASYVYFVANGVPDGVTGSPNPRGESAEAGNCAEKPSSETPATCNLYLWHAGEVNFIARLEAGGLPFETDATNWLPTAAGIFASGEVQKTARVSADGKALLFRSQRQLGPYDNERTPQLYLYRVGAGLSCISCNPTGEAPGRQPSLGSIQVPVLEPAPPASTLSRNLSADGQRVFFQTTDPLAVEDTNGAAGCPSVGSSLQNFSACSDVYEWEAPGSGSCTAARAVADGGCIYLLSTGKGSEPALIADASAEGEDLYLFSRSRLVGQDEDSLQDVYDVRIDGGLASQNQAAPPVPCESEGACRPGATPQPAAPSAATGSFVGPPNPKPSVKHKKHKHKKHHHKKKGK